MKRPPFHHKETIGLRLSEGCDVPQRDVFTMSDTTTPVCSERTVDKGNTEVDFICVFGVD